jgi:type II secretory pathway component HofQ
MRIRDAVGLLLACGALLAGEAARAAESVPADLPTPATATASAGLAERLKTPVSADFQDVDFISAIEFLAGSASANIILSEQARELGRPVTVHLVDMPLARALEYLMQGQGLLYRYDDEAIWVATRDEMESEPMETRIYLLNQGPGLFASFEPLSDTRESVALKATNLRELKTIKDVLEEVVPEVGGSALQLDERSGSLIVTHVPYYLQQIEALLAQLDVAPQQVLIEARFIEVSFTDTKEWGVDAQLTGNAALTKRTAADGTEGPGLQASSVGTALLKGTKFDFTDFANQASGLNLTFQGILSGTQYSAILHALTQNEKTKTLSAPRVTTLNNQTATIKIVTEFVYATRYEASVVRQDLNLDGDFEDVIGGVRETRFVNVPQDFVTKDLGILLHVTPSVGHDQKTITMALKPEVSEQTGSDSFGGEVSLPRFSERNLETSVVIEDGETIVLGGLMKDTSSRTVTKVPVLGSMPLIGALFRKENDSSVRSNLLIFVTANLIAPSGERLASSYE